MARSVKRGFGGQYSVLEDGVTVGEPFTGLGAKARAEEFAHNPPQTSTVKAAKLSALQGDRAYWASVNEALGKPLLEEEAELKAVLSKRRDEDEVKMLLDIFRAPLKAGKQARRRGRRVHMLPKAA